VWVSVGHALFKIATPEAMAVLLSLIEDHDSFARHMAIKAAFARGSKAAFDYLDERFGILEGKHWILVDVLFFLRNGGIGSNLEDRLNDRRWVNACARHRRDPELGHVAREVLRIAQVMDVERALREAKAVEAPPAPPRVRRCGNLVQRYHSEVRAAVGIAGHDLASEHCSFGRQPAALVPLMIRWRADAWSDVLHRSARCTRCDRKGVTIQIPGWVECRNQYGDGRQRSTRIGIPPMGAATVRGGMRVAQWRLRSLAQTLPST
jgi:hypothetical protein